MSNYHLLFTPKANEDLEQIYEYLTNNLFNEMAAKQLMRKIENSIMRLKEFPYSCSLVLDEILKMKGYRKLVVDHYLVFFLINETGKQIVIMRILYGAQNYNLLL